MRGQVGMLDSFGRALARGLKSRLGAVEYLRRQHSLRLRSRVTENGLEHRQKFVAAQVAAGPFRVRYPGPEVRDLVQCPNGESQCVNRRGRRYLFNHVIFCWLRVQHDAEMARA